MTKELIERLEAASGPDAIEYLRDNFGTCDRDAACYWGKDERGEFNGCLKTGWLGRGCQHWHPLHEVQPC